jgi:hypothetical protein
LTIDNLEATSEDVAFFERWPVNLSVKSNFNFQVLGVIAILGEPK